MALVALPFVPCADFSFPCIVCRKPGPPVLAERVQRRMHGDIT